MNRIIRFRAWIVPHPTEPNDITGRMYQDIDLRNLPLRDFEREDMKWMQFTGLKDKNGVEIYEGDIVQYETQYYGNHKISKALIEWKDDLGHDGFGEPLAMGFIFHGYNNEVIGNIYENPELHKADKPIDAEDPTSYAGD